MYALTAPRIATGLLVFLSALFSFLNGAKDGANSLATTITSRSMAPAVALWMVCLAEFAGPFIFGVAVAHTMGANVVDPATISISVVLATMLSANVWNLLMWKWGIPSSSSHALVGGLVGSVLTAARFDLSRLHPDGLIKIGLGLFLAPVAAMVVAFLFTRLTMFLLRSASPRVNWFFKRAQVFTTLGLALSHGANDAPKAMGMISLGLVAVGMLDAFTVPLWVILLSAGTIALGTLFGGQGTIRAIGTRFYRVRPYDAFSSQVVAAAISISASVAGSPVSTSQLVSSSIVGVGGAERMSKVRWGVMGNIAMGWLFTIPATILVGGLLYLVLSQWFGQ